MRRLAILLSLLGLVFVGPALRGVEIQVPEVRYALDLAYGPSLVGNRADVFWPVPGGPYPVIVYFHGGGWALGDKLLYVHRMRLLAETGYTVVNANYRLSSEARFPAAVNDCLGAVIWAKENAERFNGDPSRVAVMGDSAGAHLAAMTALAWDAPDFAPTYAGNGETTAQVQAAVLMYGGYRMEWIYREDPRLWGFIATRPLVLAFMGDTPDNAPERYWQASPASYLGRPDIPATFILCGMADTGYEESRWMYNELNRRGARVKALFVPRARHSFNYREARKDFPYLLAIIEFLKEELGGPGVEAPVPGPTGH